LMTDLQQEAKKPGKSGKKALLRALVVFAIIFALWASYWFVNLRPLERTDDAYVAGNQIRVYSRTSGRVLEIYTDDTKTVAAGDLLVRLDPTDAALALEQAKSALGSAVREIFSLAAQSDRLKVLIEARAAELRLIEAEYKRRQNLKKGSSVTAEEVERYRSQVAVAEANLEAARLELEAAQRRLGPGPLIKHPQVTLAGAKLKEAFLALKRCEIRSPSSGRVARRTVQVGAEITPATPLMAIVPTEQVWVDANFKEIQLGRIKPGQRAIVKADMYGRKVEYEGTVIGLAAGTGNAFSLLPAENATGNWIKVVQRVPVRIAFKKEDLLKAPLLLGLSLKVDVRVLEPPGPIPQASGAAVYQLEEEQDYLNELDKLLDNVIISNISDTFIGHRLPISID
jgi:membrane fusion protein (multidrug efflux system)